MRIAAAALAASLMLLAGPPASAAPAAPEAPARLAASRAQQLDTLFARLKSAKDDAAARQAEDGIIALWLQSGSATVDLLMAWSVQAIADKDYPEALDILDRVVTLDPDYAEGWNKRATVYFLIEDYGQAVADIEHVLVLEPRHFGALVGLGAIFHALGEDNRAIAAYKQALALDPYLDNARKALRQLEETTGRNI